MNSKNAIPVPNRHALQIVPLDGALCDNAVPAVSFSGLTPALLRRAAPAVVLSWLYARDHDAVDVARKLNEVGFTGRYRVSCRPLPRPGIVRRELMAICPGMTLEIDQIQTGEALHDYDTAIAHPGTDAGAQNMQDMGFLKLLA